MTSYSAMSSERIAQLPYECDFTEGDRVHRVVWVHPDRGLVEGVPGTIVCAPRGARAVVVHFDGDMHFTIVREKYALRHVGPWVTARGDVFFTDGGEVLS